jgi:hypothetical protein
MKFIATLCLAFSALAHFDIFYPTPRTNEIDGSEEGPCGRNFDTPTDIRTEVDVKNFSLELGIEDLGGEMTVNVSVGVGGFIHILSTFVTDTELEIVPVDLASIPNLKNGDLLTVQVVQVAEDGTAYSCVDIIATGLP